MACDTFCLFDRRIKRFVCLPARRWNVASTISSCFCCCYCSHFLAFNTLVWIFIMLSHTHTHWKCREISIGKRTTCEQMHHIQRAHAHIYMYVLVVSIYTLLLLLLAIWTFQSSTKSTCIKSYILQSTLCLCKAFHTHSYVYYTYIRWFFIAEARSPCLTLYIKYIQSNRMSYKRCAFGSARKKYTGQVFLLWFTRIYVHFVYKHFFWMHFDYELYQCYTSHGPIAIQIITPSEYVHQFISTQTSTYILHFVVCFFYITKL